MTCILLVCALLSLTSCSRPVDSSGPLFPVCKNNKWCFINQSGQVAITTQYQVSRYDPELRDRVMAHMVFQDGLSPMLQLGEKESENRWGYIDKRGAFVIPPKYWDALPFSDGLAAVSLSTSEGYGFIDTFGNMQIPCKFGMNFALSIFDRNLGKFSEGLFPATEGGPGALFGYIDRTGHFAIAPRFAEAAPFSEGLAAVTEGNHSGYGFINPSGEFVIRSHFFHANSFHEGLAAVEIYDNGNPLGWGYIDKSGKLVIPPVPSPTGRDFSEGLAAVGFGSGFIDKSGHKIIPQGYDAVWDFSEGLAAVYQDKKWGFIDQTGKIVIKPQFERVNEFRDGLALVGVEKGDIPGGTHWIWGYIDKSGLFVWKPSE